MMKQQNPKCKPYSEDEYPVHSVREPEVEYQTANLTFEEDFARRCAKGLTPEQFLQAMYKRIDAWPWEKR